MTKPTFTKRDSCYIRRRFFLNKTLYNFNTYLFYKRKGYGNNRCAGYTAIRHNALKLIAFVV